MTESIHRTNTRDKMATGGADEVAEEAKPVEPPMPWEIRKKQLCLAIVQNTVFSTSMTILTVYALFGDDIKMLSTEKTADDYFNVVICVTMFMFCVEIVLQSIGKDGYYGGFFFWLDLISTLSLPLDMTWVTDLLFASSEEGSGEEQAGMARAGRASRAGTRAGRIIRVIRLVRLIRIVKLYKHSQERLKRQREKKEGGVAPGEDADGHVLDSDDADGGGGTESRVGKKLSELTTRRVIIVVLLLMCSAPILDPKNWRMDFPASSEHGGEAIAHRWESFQQVALSNGLDPQNLPAFSKDNLTGIDLLHQRGLYERALVFFVGFHHKGSKWMTDPDSGRQQYGSVLLWLKAPLALTPDESVGPFQESVDGKCHLVWKGRAPLQAPHDMSIPCETGTALMDQAQIRSGVTMDTDEKSDKPYELLRRAERDVVIAHPELKFYFDRRYMSMIDALCSISQTVFICFVLCVGALMFSKDANDLVLNPIERMVNKMDKIRDNPLAATRLGDANEQAKENEANKEKEKGKLKKKKQKAEPLETQMLEKTIIKLGGLLALGFGEAGAEIIGQNIKGSDMSFLGRKMLGIFGFCDIRNFTDATEVLQDQVMVFVNQIAEIVHSIVDQYSGAANKNIGDAFLLVWRLSDLEQSSFWKLQFEDKEKKSLTRRQSRLSQLKNSKNPEEPVSPKTVPKVSKQKEQQIMQQVISKMTDMALMSFIKIIVSINKSAVLAEYRTHEGLCRRMPGYKVKMGFGLHLGWAIEGPIGSEFKIDASYLSPNVNMASRLEAATKQYGTPMLLSGFFVERLTPESRKYCRRIDCVRVKGSKQPVEMWVVDMDTDRLKVQAEEEKQVIRSKFKKRQLREAAKTRMWIPSYTIHSQFETDADLMNVREPFTEEFLTLFADGYLKYEKGDWQGAREIFAQTQTMLGLAPDGPSVTLLGVMKEHFFISPENWQGCRDLTEK
eukprot:gnl/MRDRNA2_/MRDRNA2_58879_c0_seq1.p1 gnl/MRDRNA2_/MRDRNA2_58879_c0~~gnl/MRDRNA2_/MRDRNA2_58879_c0_seq1.p1  ORF type:complete len:955 (+),score=207.34 gnl/MRDRNA2_/MRDRNA2_58879_c0_seq1:94-2958(+)